MVSLSEGIDLGSINGQLLYNIMSAINQFVHQCTAQTTRDNMAHVKANRCTTGVPPYGWMIDRSRPETRHHSDQTYYPHLIEEPTEQKALAHIADLHHLSAHPQKIADKLNKAGFRNRLGREWTGAHLLRILRRSAQVL